MNIALIQSRMSSERLPGKALLKIHEHPLIYYVIERAKKIPGVDKVALATSESSENDSLQAYAESLGVEVYRGDEDDVVGRFYELAKRNRADNIIRITGDNPLIDFKTMGVVLDAHLRHQADYSCCTGYPVGSTGDIFSFRGLEATHLSGKGGELQDHVDLHVLENPKEFKLIKLESSENLSVNRWTVDYPEDLELVRELFEDIHHDIMQMGAKEIIENSSVASKLERVVEVSEGNRYTGELVSKINIIERI